MYMQTDRMYYVYCIHTIKFAASQRESVWMRKGTREERSRRETVMTRVKSLEKIENKRATIVSHGIT